MEAPDVAGDKAHFPLTYYCTALRHKDKLMELKELLDLGILNQEEFQLQKQALLSGRAGLSETSTSIGTMSDFSAHNLSFLIRGFFRRHGYLLSTLYICDKRHRSHVFIHRSYMKCNTLIHFL